MAKRKGGFLKGTLIGAVAAGIGALLFAPKSGKETREDLQSSFDDVKSQLNKGLEEIKEASVRVKDDSVVETKALIKRAEKLKQDLNATALKLSSVGNDTKGEVSDQAGKLVTEGRAMLAELEALGKQLGTSATREIKQATSQIQKETAKTAAQAKKAVSKTATTAKKTTAKATKSVAKGTKKATSTTKAAAKRVTKNATKKK
jgi:gas vesicle protein